MSLISLLVTVIIICAIGGLAWLAITRIPMPEPFRIVILVVCCIIGILFLASLLPGHGGSLPSLR